MQSSNEKYNDKINWAGKKQSSPPTDAKKEPQAAELKMGRIKSAGNYHESDLTACVGEVSTKRIGTVSR